MALATAPAVLSISFVVLPANYALLYYTSPETRWYVPTSMVQTTIQLERAASVEAAVAWLNDNAGPNGWIVVSNVFSGFWPGGTGTNSTSFTLKESTERSRGISFPGTCICHMCQACTRTFE